MSNDVRPLEEGDTVRLRDSRQLGRLTDQSVQDPWAGLVVEVRWPRGGRSWHHADLLVRVDSVEALFGGDE